MENCRGLAWDLPCSIFHQWPGGGSRPDWNFQMAPNCGGPAYILEGQPAIQRGLGRLEKWSDKNFMKLSKGKSQAWPQGGELPCSSPDWGRPAGEQPWGPCWAAERGPVTCPGLYLKGHRRRKGIILLYAALTRPYLSPVWGPPTQNMDKLERVQQRAPTEAGAWAFALQGEVEGPRLL